LTKRQSAEKNNLQTTLYICTVQSVTRMLLLLVSVHLFGPLSINKPTHLLIVQLQKAWTKVRNFYCVKDIRTHTFHRV